MFDEPARADVKMIDVVNRSADKNRLAQYIAEAKNFLEAYGNHVAEEDIPGLYRINNGPEITVGQLLQQAAKLRDEVSK